MRLARCRSGPMSSGIPIARFQARIRGVRAWRQDKVSSRRSVLSVPALCLFQSPTTLERSSAHSRRYMGRIGFTTDRAIQIAHHDSWVTDRGSWIMNRLITDKQTELVVYGPFYNGKRLFHQYPSLMDGYPIYPLNSEFGAARLPARLIRPTRAHQLANAGYSMLAIKP